jgi:hypothetical protein
MLASLSRGTRPHLAMMSPRSGLEGRKERRLAIHYHIHGIYISGFMMPPRTRLENVGNPRVGTEK